MSPRNSKRVDRRRRVLADETRNEGHLVGKPRIFRGDSDAPPCRYNSLALQSLNAPIVQYLPLRPFSLLLWFLIGLIPIQVLLVLHEWQPTIGQRIGRPETLTFVLGTPGSMASWFSSATFAFSVLVILGIYSVRRHRRDDHRGRFTVWRLGIAAAIVASIECTTGIHRTLQAICEVVAGGAGMAANALWIGVYGIFFGSILVRLLFEMAPAKLAMTWMTLAGLGYLLAATVELNMGALREREAAHTLQHFVLLMGHHCVLFSLICYARQIVLEAMGVLASPAVRQPVEPSRAQQTAEKSGREQVGQPRLRVAATAQDSDHKPSRTSSHQSSPQLSVHTEDGTQPEVTTTQLSKAERRRLRKEKRRKAA